MPKQPIIILRTKLIKKWLKCSGRVIGKEHVQDLPVEVI